MENVALSDALFFGVIASRDRQARSASIGIPETQEHRVGAVTAGKPPIFISDHRPELDAHEHLGSKGLGLYRSALRLGPRVWHDRGRESKMQQSVEKKRAVTSTKKTHRHFGRNADSSADSVEY